jgi:hypothetical protein
VNFHIRSARNLPIRESSEERMKQYLQEENRFNPMNQMFNMGNRGGFFQQNDLFQNYGAGLFNQRPSINMTGHTFFHPNMANPNLINQEINYDSRSILERVNARVELKFKKKFRISQCFEGPFPEWN